jgi:hypothetical protein
MGHFYNFHVSILKYLLLLQYMLGKFKLTLLKCRINLAVNFIDAERDCLHY